MRIQLASDIHLEQNPGMNFDDVLTPSAEVLILAGDIGDPSRKRYGEFLKSCGKAYKHTILVAGNHEYRRMLATHSMEQVDDHLCALCAAAATPTGSVHYLAHGQTLVIGGVQFIGATLFSHVDEAVFGADRIAQLDAQLNRQMMNSKKPWSVKANNDTFAAHAKAIDRAIRAGCKAGHRNVVVTHYAPLLTGPFHYIDRPKDYLYGTDLSARMDGRYLFAWFYGHTHDNYVGDVNGVLVASNMYGICGVGGWDRTATIEIPAPDALAAAVAVAREAAIDRFAAALPQVVAAVTRQAKAAAKAAAGAAAAAGIVGGTGGQAASVFTSDSASRAAFGAAAPVSRAGKAAAVPGAGAGASDAVLAAAKAKSAAQVAAVARHCGVIAAGATAADGSAAPKNGMCACM